MTRAAALAWLKREYARPSADAEWAFTSAEDEGVWQNVLDSAIRALGASEANLAGHDVPQDEVGDYLLLLRYFALDALTREFALWVDIKADDPAVAKSYSQRYKAFKALFDAAKTDIAKTGLLNSGYGFGSLTLDIYEPTVLY